MELFRSLIPFATSIALATTFAAQASAEDAATAVVAAYEPEWQEIASHVVDKTDAFVGGVHFVQGSLAGARVVVVESGVGPVNAAAATQLAIDRFHVTRIVVVGIAGGVDASLHIGDVVVPEHWAEALFSVFARQQGQDYVLPPFPFVSNKTSHYGMIFPQPDPVGHAPAAPGQERWIAIDPELARVARSTAAHTELARCSAPAQCLKAAPRIVVGGNGVSGSAFVDNADFRGFLVKVFQARAVDMESAAVGHVAAANGVPFIAFRSLSDLAGGGPEANEMQTFQALASKNATNVLIAFLGHLKRD